MRSDVALDFAIFQLTPTRTRYSLSPACNDIHPFAFPHPHVVLIVCGKSADDDDDDDDDDNDVVPMSIVHVVFVVPCPR